MQLPSRGLRALQKEGLGLRFRPELSSSLDWRQRIARNPTVHGRSVEQLYRCVDPRMSANNPA